MGKYPPARSIYILLRYKKVWIIECTSGWRGLRGEEEGGREKWGGGLNCKNTCLQSGLSCTLWRGEGGGGRGEGDREGGQG